MDLGYIKHQLSDKDHQFPFNIKIACTGEATLPIEELSEFQGNLKSRDEDDIVKILKSIRDYGFSFPFFLWKSGKKNYILDGHGRLYALKIYKTLGGVIPPLPYCDVEADNEQEAKQKLLRQESKYGKIDIDSLREFVEGLDVDTEQINLPDIDLDNLVPPSMFGGAESGVSSDNDKPPSSKEPQTIECPKCGFRWEV